MTDATSPNLNAEGAETETHLPNGTAGTNKLSDSEEPPKSTTAPPRPDVLWCLTLKETGKTSKNLYRDVPWKGINSGLPDSEPVEDNEAKSVLVYYVDATVILKKDVKGNTSKTWREDAVDFEFGRDAVLSVRHWPSVGFYSKALVKLLEQVLDYYPGRGSWAFFSSEVEDAINGLMYCYAELKEYFLRWVPALSTEEKENTRQLHIGNCGDAQIQDVLRPFLDFGSLDMGAKAEAPGSGLLYDIAVLLRLLSGMYRVKMVPTLTSVLLSTNPMVDYTSLWTFFRPGTRVYVQQVIQEHDPRKIGKAGDARIILGDTKSSSNEYCAFIISTWKYHKRDVAAKDTIRQLDRLELTFWNIQYDGSGFRRVPSSAFIPKFDGSKHIKDLAVIPAAFFDKYDGNTLRVSLEKRGRKYLSIVREPAALRIYHDQRSGYEGHIIVDPEAYRQYEASDREIGDFGEIMTSVFSGMSFVGRQDTNDVDIEFTYQRDPNGIVQDGGGGRFAALTKFDLQKFEDYERIEEVYQLLPRTLQGFGLNNKKWMVFEIDAISDTSPVVTQNQLDEELVLVSDTDKDALRTVLPRGKNPIATTSDFVDGKGEGKVFLLYGGPGTGKTLTVECLANDTARPLLRLTAQDVGLASQSESHLRKWFTLAAKWHAILLIDEADLFLEQRKEGDIQRNSLSTVFLRTMEYYKGILFLTTNRPGHIDDSFISRITCPIEYPSLSMETKRRIIERFVRRFEDTGTVVVASEAVEHLVETCQELNGRQIRNVLQNAVASAENSVKRGQQSEAPRKMVTVNVRHVKAAVERQVGFQKYLGKLKGRDEQGRARNKQDYLPR